MLSDIAGLQDFSSSAFLVALRESLDFIKNDGVMQMVTCLEQQLLTAKQDTNTMQSR